MAKALESSGSVMRLRCRSEKSERITVSPCGRRGGPVPALRGFSFLRLARIPAIKLGLLLVACCPPISAQISQKLVRLPTTDGSDIRFTRISFGGGPSYGRVSEIVEDDQGFLWFGTHDGLQRYDGYRVREYRNDPRNPNSLSGNFIMSLFKDRAGKLWVASNHYLDRYDPITDTFTHYRFGPGTGGQVVHISQDGSGMIWLSTDSGLDRLDPLTGKITLFAHRPGDPDSLNSNHISSTFQQKDGTFWVATGEELDIFNPETGKVLRRVKLGGTFPLQLAGPIRLYEDHSGVLWVVFSSENGLAQVDRQAGRLIYYSLGGAGSENTLFAGVRSIREDRDGALWLGTNSGGLLKFDGNRKAFVRYRNDPHDPDSLSADRVDALFEDHEGGMWVGTTGGGVNRFSTRPLPFQRFRFEHWTHNSQNRNTLSTVFEDSRGTLWIATTGSLLRFDSKTGKSASYAISGASNYLPTTYVQSIAEDHSGSVWFGTYGGGIRRFDPRTERFTVYLHDPADPESLSDNIVPVLLVDRKGTLWAGTLDGLDAFDPRTQHFHVYKDPIEHQSLYRAIGEGSDGTLWLGTWDSGLRRFDTAIGQFTNFGPGTLSALQVNAICVDHEGAVWIATASGINRFDPATNQVTSYDERDGLPNANVNGILEDDRGDLWLSTNNGVSRFDPSLKTFKNYSVGDGLPANEFYGANAGFKSRTGKMFFCSRAGLTTFSPEKVLDNLYVPPVVLTDFQLFGQQVPVGSGSPLSQSIALTRSLTLSHLQTVFSFEFSALSFASPERNRYRYRLEGLENKWNEVDSTRRFVTYTTLSPGDYVFRVQGSNNRGVWNETGAAIHIRILPPWWSTWWFRGIAAAFVLLSLWLAYTLRLRTVEWRNIELALQVAERTAAEQEIRALSERLINAQEQERTRIARDLHDDLSQQIAAISLSLGSVRRRLLGPNLDAHTILEKVRDQLSQLSAHVRELSHELHPAVLDYCDVAAAVRGHCKEFSAVTGVNVSFSSSGSFEDVPQDATLCIYRVTQEALQNVAKHAAATSAEVRLERIGSTVCLTVSDRGVGFRSESRRSGGLGLLSIHERVRLVRGVVQVQSAPYHGTTLRACIPLKPAAGSALPEVSRGSETRSS